MTSIELLIRFPIQLFFVLTPVAAIATLVSMTQNSSLGDRIRISVEASVIAAVILFICAIFGPIIFSIFRITPEAFQIAGGLYLMLIGKDLAFSSDCEPGKISEKSNKNLAITPLAMPLLTGPGTISYVFLMRSKVTTNLGLLKFLFGIGIAISAVAICFISAVKASNSIPKNVMNFCQKITGIMILCISAQVLAAGINTII